MLIFALASFPIVFSQQISYAVKLPTGYWWIFIIKYPKLTYGNELTISSVAVTTDNIYKVTGSLYGKPISGTYDEGSGKITLQTSSASPNSETSSVTAVYTGYLITEPLNRWGIFIEEPECLPNVCKYTLVGTFGSAGSIVPEWYATLISSR